MTDYTKSTNFTSKDSLSTGNPLKIIKGTEFDTEFNAISTAIATKADIASPTFTGTPAAPTASAGTSSTQIATTAFMATMYPVGSIYSSTVSTNPNTLFGFGTWVAYAAGRVMIGNGGGFSAGATGGSADAIAVSHTHTYSGTTNGQSNTHTHTASVGTTSANGGFLSSDPGGSTTATVTTGNASADHTHTYSGTTASSGSSGTNANLQPYIVVYMWNRTA